MFADTLIERGLLPPDWQTMRPTELMELADTISPHPAREWIIELAHLRAQTLRDAGWELPETLLRRRAGAQERLSASSIENEVIERSRAEAIAMVNIHGKGWWRKSVHAYLAQNRKLRRLCDRREEYRKRLGERQANRSLRSLDDQIDKIERSLVGDRQVTGVPLKRLARILEETKSVDPAVYSELQGRIVALRKSIELDRQAVLDDIDAQIAHQDAIVQTSSDDLVYPPDPAGEDEYFWNSPLVDGRLHRITGGIAHQPVFRVTWNDNSQRADKLMRKFPLSRMRAAILQSELFTGKNYTTWPLSFDDIADGLSGVANPQESMEEKLIVRKIFKKQDILLQQKQQTVAQKRTGETLWGKIIEDKESDTLRWLNERGATTDVDYRHIPSYSSWATVTHPGCYRLSGDKYDIVYIPYMNTEQFSSRGLLRIWAEDIDAVLRMLPFLGERVHFIGQSVSPHPQLASLHRLDPSPQMVLHGLTGADTPQAANKRLQAIIKAGGLLSTQVRGLRGINYHSLSPLGDIASGVDWGVPCKIGQTPSYGKIVVFGLKPWVLHRRDIWFSDRDFGGGHNRFDEYNQYAASIGQEVFWKPPSVASRQQHLQSPAVLKPENEVWFAGGVRLEEIDTIWIQNVPELQWVHKHFERVVTYENETELQAKIKARGKALQGVAYDPPQWQSLPVSVL